MLRIHMLHIIRHSWYSGCTVRTLACYHGEHNPNCSAVRSHFGMTLLTGAAEGTAASVSGHDQAAESSSHAAQTGPANPAAAMSDSVAEHNSPDDKAAPQAPPDGIVTKLMSAAEAALSKLTTNGSSQAEDERTTPQPA